MFGLGLQVMIHLIILVSKARDAPAMDMTGAAAFGHGPLVVSIRLVSLALEAKVIKCIMIWSPRPNIVGFRV